MICTKGDGDKMTCLNDLGRRSFLKSAAVLGGATTLGAVPNHDAHQQNDTQRQTDTPAIMLQDVPLSSGAKLTVERRGQIVLFGINRPYIQNRIDPETFENSPKHITNMTTILRCAPRFYLATGRTFQEGSTLKDLSRLAGTGKPWIASTGTIDPLAKRAPRLTKPLIVVTHGDTWIWPMSSILLPTSVLLQPTPASARMRIHTDAFPEEDRPSGSRRK
jgi:enoyl-CoA hydratase